MRSWLVIPVGGVAAAAIAVGLRAAPLEVVAVALAAAGVAGAIRTLAGDGPGAVAAAAIGAVLVAASLLEHGGALGLPSVAFAAACWAFAELVEPESRSESRGRRAVALIPAVIAAVLQPSLVVLLPFAGLRAPWRRRTIVVAGMMIVGVAVAAGVARHGPLAELGARWLGHGGRVAPNLFAERLADGVGPLTAVAALAGLAATVVGRARIAELALAACTAGSVLVDLRAGAIAPVTLGLAALWAGLAIARLAALVRLRAGQAIVAATAGALLIAPPAWSVIEHGPRVAILR